MQMNRITQKECDTRDRFGLFISKESGEDDGLLLGRSSFYVN